MHKLSSTRNNSENIPSQWNAHALYSSPLYSEGSEACRNYSRLTMRVRTLAQHVLIVYVIAISVAILSGKFGIEQGTNVYIPILKGNVLMYAGLILGLFSVSLALVDWHYQSAFTAIRDALREMEGNLYGPWKAHKRVRNSRNDFIASYVPFWILWGIGLGSFVFGIYLVKFTPKITWVIAVTIFIFGFLAFIYIGLNQGDDALKDEKNNSS
jgi:hypothetical protein